RFNIHITDAGRQIIAEHAAKHVQLVNELFAALSQDDIETLGRILQTLNHQTDMMKDTNPSPSRR
ncbi:MAG TPA: hypothetical protein PKJ56_00730, partial [Promineifilum sp.]|nr:hypothetical protein [Promineifilum sp.]